jgi:hypothetical protein
MFTFSGRARIVPGYVALSRKPKLPVILAGAVFDFVPAQNAYPLYMPAIRSLCRGSICIYNPRCEGRQPLRGGAAT